MPANVRDCPPRAVRLPNGDSKTALLGNIAIARHLTSKRLFIYTIHNN